MSRRKNSLAPIEDTQVVENDTRQPVIDDKLTETSNIDAYISKSEDAKTDFSEKDAEIEVLNEKIQSLEKEKEEFIVDNQTLLDKIESLMKEKESSKTDDLINEINRLNSENSKLRNYNDSLTLKNSELEFEVSRLTETVKNIQSKIDSRLHTYTKPGYSGSGGFVPSKNGYQDWR